jgi:hypothetical protein
MEYILLILFLLIVSLKSQGQYLLGLNEEGVKKNARILGDDSDIKFTKTWYQDKTYALNWYDDQIECKVMVAFNKFTGLSVITCLIPADSTVLKALKMSFDEENFKKIGDSWIIKRGGKVMKVEEIENKGEKILVFREISPNEEY